MDDFIVSNLQESKNEWCIRLISIFVPRIHEGFVSIFNEAWNICVTSNETNKYLMTFQNLISRVPKWNATIVEEERKRIVEKSGCQYLEDLITCVHIIQLKVLTCIRVGNKQKKVDISIPKLDNFIHKIYIHTARKLYTNVYLFEKTNSPLLRQRNMHDFETIINECIMMSIRDSIPTESIIKAYLDEAVEDEEHVIIENIPVEEPTVVVAPVSTPTVVDEPFTTPSIKNIDEEKVVTRLTFNDYDAMQETDKTESIKKMSKDVDTLEARAIQRRLAEKEQEQEDDYDEDSGRLTISDEHVSLGFDDEVAVETDDIPLLDFEELNF